MEPEELTWVDHPARRAPLRLALTALVMIGTAMTVQLAGGGLELGLVSIGVLTVAAGPFLFPTRYTLSAKGVSRVGIFGSRSRRWEELRRWQVDRNGILVSPFRSPSMLDDLRGLYLRGGPRAEVLVFLEARLGPAALVPDRRNGEDKALDQTLKSEDAG